MKTLLVLRHAKSSWKDSSINDHDRELNQRGRYDAPRMGQLLRDEGLVPDIILSSTAMRARETTEAVVDTSGFNGELQFSSTFYLATSEVWIEAIVLLSEEYKRVMIVGHNPGLEILVDQLTGCEEPFPTATLAHIQLVVDHWTELSRQPTAHLVELWRPKEL
ncbi:MAG: hypothetical protein CMJ81_03485 [Planctomycetaceae bacterium]|jgi:phosphohistidine phosphatase|nr:hypothetical protein [Planctomycetaceae bacterium]MBP60105.1 hypothetical protein [Planctomycetaceae bacterium]